MGWKDILRPIRDGLRDNLPHRQPSEDKQRKDQRLRQRQQDSLLGFTYLDNFEELEEWTADAIDPLQRANTPLLVRAPLSNQPRGSKSNTTIIHDYSGNYHEYESCQQNQVQTSSYSCEYLQIVDNFVYFSHKLVCIPPPAWTNTLHRNGVKSFGTFLVEPQAPDISKILEHNTDADGRTEFVISRRLVEIASAYGFDGWLINIEKTFPVTKWKPEYLVGFLSQLHDALGTGNVIWYDALTVNNMIKYQNSLTPQNLPFAKAAGSILTNYAWTPEKSQAAKVLALDNNMLSENIIMGIDVWAQNTGNGEHPRKTWPLEGGGGTGTGLGVAALADVGVSCGIFAPAWPFEHFSRDSRAVERSMWHGTPLPQHLDCDCRSDPHHIALYQTFSIEQSAVEHAAGSETFFHSDFQQAFETDKNGLLAHIGWQSVLPKLKDQGSGTAVYAELRNCPCRLVVGLNRKTAQKESSSAELRTSRTQSSRNVRLFDLNMAWKLPLILRIRYRRLKTQYPIAISICFEGLGFNCMIPLINIAAPDETITFKVPRHCNVLKDTLQARLTGLSIHLEDNGHVSGAGGGIEVLEIYEISIQRVFQDFGRYSIDGLYLDSQNGDMVSHTRICWNFTLREDPESNDLPISAITGPFSYFEVFVAEQLFGRAYALQFVLDESTVKQIEGDKDIMIRIVGYGFDGRLIASCSSHVSDLQANRDSWQVVERSGSLGEHIALSE